MKKYDRKLLKLKPKRFPKLTGKTAEQEGTVRINMILDMLNLEADNESSVIHIKSDVTLLAVKTGNNFEMCYKDVRSFLLYFVSLTASIGDTG